MPQDPASGAARSDRTVAEWLSRAGFAVAALGTTATEQGQPEPAPLYLSKLGCKPRVDARGAVGGRLPLIRFEHRGVAYTLMNTGAESIKGWQEAHSPQFDKLLERMIDEHKPEVVFTYGGTRFDVARRALVRSRGCALVFALHNLGYLAPRSLDWALLDGNHDGEYLHAELARLLGVMKPGSLVFLDDCDDSWPEVAAAFDAEGRSAAWRTVATDGRIGVLERTPEAAT